MFSSRCYIIFFAPKTHLVKGSLYCSTWDFNSWIPTLHWHRYQVIQHDFRGVSPLPCFHSKPSVYFGKPNVWPMSVAVFLLWLSLIMASLTVIGTTLVLSSSIPSKRFYTLALIYALSQLYRGGEFNQFNLPQVELQSRSRCITRINKANGMYLTTIWSATAKGLNTFHFVIVGCWV